MRVMEGSQHDKLPVTQVVSTGTGPESGMAIGGTNLAAGAVLAGAATGLPSSATRRLRMSWQHLGASCTRVPNVSLTGAVDSCPTMSRSHVCRLRVAVRKFLWCLRHRKGALIGRPFTICSRNCSPVGSVGILGSSSGSVSDLTWREGSPVLGCTP